MIWKYFYINRLCGFFGRMFSNTSNYLTFGVESFCSKTQKKKNIYKHKYLHVVSFSQKI